MISVKLADGSVVSTDAGTVDEILSRLGQNPYEILVTCNGELLLGEDCVADGASIVLSSIVHGG